MDALWHEENKEGKALGDQRKEKEKLKVNEGFARRRMPQPLKLGEEL